MHSTRRLLTRQNRLWLTCTLLAILIRLFFVSDIYLNRESPVEPDDAYTYIAKGAILIKDPGFESPALRPLGELPHVLPQTTVHDFISNQIYYRFRLFYSTGHSLLFSGFLMAGVSAEAAWWILLAIYSVLAVTGAGALAFAVGGESLAVFTVVVYASVGLFTGFQYAAPPVTWSLAGFVWLVALLLLDRSNGQGRSAGRWVAIIVALFLCVTTHSLGAALAAQALLIDGSVRFLEKRTLRSLFPTALLAGLTLVALSINPLVEAGVGLLTYPARPRYIGLDMGGLRATIQEIVPAYGLARKWPVPFGMPILVWGLGFAMNAVGSVRAVTSRNWKLLAFLLTGTAAYVSLSFMYIDYAPLPNDRMHLGGYYRTVGLLVAVMGIGYGLESVFRAVAPRIRRIPVSVCMLIAALVLTTAITGPRAARAATTPRDRKAQLGNPSRAYEAVNSWLGRNESRCLDVYSLTLLATSIIETDLQTPLRYNRICETEGRFHLGPEAPCEIAIVPSDSFCKVIPVESILYRGDGYLVYTSDPGPARAVR